MVPSTFAVPKISYESAIRLPSTWSDSFEYRPGGAAGSTAASGTVPSAPHASTSEARVFEPPPASPIASNVSTVIEMLDTVMSPLSVTLPGNATGVVCHGTMTPFVADASPPVSAPSGATTSVPWQPAPPSRASRPTTGRTDRIPIGSATTVPCTATAQPREYVKVRGAIRPLAVHRSYTP